jgi:hypothetical protein
MILDAATKKLEILLGGAVTANQLPFQCEWVDVTTTTSTPGTNGLVTNGATPVDLVPVPGASTQRIVNGINIYNADTAPATVTVRFNDNATLRTLKVVTLAVGDTLAWSLADLWEVVDSSGNKKNNVNTGNWLKTTVILTGTVTFTTLAGTHTIFCRGVAGGGGGGGCSWAASNFAFGGGGAGGGYFEKTFAVTPLTAYTVAVGVNGTAGANTGGTGGTGGDTTIAVGGVTVTAKGGLGGVGMVTGATLIFALGGAHGTISTNGDLNGAGAPGNPGIRHSGLLGCSGAGGSSDLGGGGGEGKNAHSVGIAGLGYGAGGGGGAAMTAAVLGGVGTEGVLVIDEFA